MMKNAFYFILKAVSILKILKFLLRFCGHVGKTALFKIRHVKPGLRTIFLLELANKKPLFTKSANLVTARKFSIQPQATTQGKCSLLMYQKS